MASAYPGPHGLSTGKALTRDLDSNTFRNMSNIESLQRQADTFRALSNPHRLALFQRLMHCCAPGTRCDAEQEVRLCVGELGQGMAIAPSTLSHHLKELHRAGLIQMQRQGKTIQCWVEPSVLETISQFFSPSLTPQAR